MARSEPRIVRRVDCCVCSHLGFCLGNYDFPCHQATPASTSIAAPISIGSGPLSLRVPAATSIPPRAIKKPSPRTRLNVFSQLRAAPNATHARTMLMMIDAVDIIQFLPNVQEHATPLAGAGVETGMEVHVTGDVADRAASGGCSVSPCSRSLFGVQAGPCHKIIIEGTERFGEYRVRVENDGYQAFWRVLNETLGPWLDLRIEPEHYPSYQVTSAEVTERYQRWLASQNTSSPNPHPSLPSCSNLETRSESSHPS